MSSLFTQNKRQEQARNVQSYSTNLFSEIDRSKSMITTLLGIKEEWDDDDEVCEQDRATLNAVFVTARTKAAALMTEILKGIPADGEATTTETTEN